MSNVKTAMEITILKADAIELNEKLTKQEAKIERLMQVSEAHDSLVTYNNNLCTKIHILQNSLTTAKQALGIVQEAHDTQSETLIQCVTISDGLRKENEVLKEKLKETNKHNNDTIDYMLD